jgi:hypothetical protein
MLSAMLLACAVTWHQFDTVIHAERTFFGSYHVSQDARRRFHILYHGTTLHGMESLDPSRQQEPLTYYHRSGPFGRRSSDCHSYATRPTLLRWAWASDPWRRSGQNSIDGPSMRSIQPLNESRETIDISGS